MSLKQNSKDNKQHDQQQNEQGIVDKVDSSISTDMSQQEKNSVAKVIKQLGPLKTCTHCSYKTDNNTCKHNLDPRIVSRQDGNATKVVQLADLQSHQHKFTVVNKTQEVTNYIPLNTIINQENAILQLESDMQHFNQQIDFEKQINCFIREEDQLSQKLQFQQKNQQQQNAHALTSNFASTDNIKAKMKELDETMEQTMKQQQQKLKHTDSSTELHQLLGSNINTNNEPDISNKQSEAKYKQVSLQQIVDDNTKLQLNAEQNQLINGQNNMQEKNKIYCPSYNLYNEILNVDSDVLKNLIQNDKQNIIQQLQRIRINEQQAKNVVNASSANTTNQAVIIQNAEQQSSQKQHQANNSQLQQENNQNIAEVILIQSQNSTNRNQEILEQTQRIIQSEQTAATTVKNQTQPDTFADSTQQQQSNSDNKNQWAFDLSQIENKNVINQFILSQIQRISNQELANDLQNIEHQAYELPNEIIDTKINNNDQNEVKECNIEQQLAKIDENETKDKNQNEQKQQQQTEQNIHSQTSIQNTDNENVNEAAEKCNVQAILESKNEDNQQTNVESQNKDYVNICNEQEQNQSITVVNNGENDASNTIISNNQQQQPSMNDQHNATGQQVQQDIPVPQNNNFVETNDNKEEENGGQMRKQQM